MKKYRKGFTLVELLLVVTILGILAALALPRFFPQAEKSRVAEAIGILSAIRQGEEAYNLENGSYLSIIPIPSGSASTVWQSIGIADPNTSANRYFNYDVNAPGTATTFIAHATRILAVQNTMNLAAGTSDQIGIDNTGTYCGNHPYTPSNAGTAAAACAF